MKKLLLLFFFFSLLSAEAQFWKKSTSTTPTASEVTKALKEALQQGATKGAAQVSQLDGYFKNPEIKIPFPQDVQMVESKMRALGMGKQVDEFVLSLNRAAEDAAKQAAPIFVSAIQKMSIEDAYAILKGQPDAATQYLSRTTTPQLKEKFMPIVKASLDKVNATRYYADLIGYYNRVPFVQKVNPDLTGYATDKAIAGLFVMIAKEEKNIRKDPLARTTDLLKKVFSSVTK
ncbi:MAG: DUF4197 domain-containing protein [Cyclobacteriaceae bacterium]|nr:DUF4197 domain-containing protein [Cyclobacteriaceae bacterium]